MSPHAFMMRERNIFSRTVGKLGPGSLRGSILNMCNTAIGAGVLSLPFAFKRNGIIVGVVLVILAAISAYFSLMILVNLGSKYKIYNYSSLAERAGGPKLRSFL